MADNEMKIVLTLDDQVTAGLKNASSSIDTFAKNMKHVGREISQVGSSIAMVGGSITGMFAVALKNASKSVKEADQSLKAIQNTLSVFQEKVVKAIVPILQEFSRVLNNLYNAFNNLSPAMQTSIIQGTLMVGVIATLAGGSVFLIGKITTLIANVIGLTSAFMAFAAVNAPLLITVGIVVAVGAAMLKWKWVADTVMSTFEFLFLTIKNGFLTVKMVMETVMAGILSGWSNVINTLAMIPNPMQEQMQGLAMELENASVLMNRMAYDDMQGIITNADAMGNILKTGEGSWSNGFEKMKVSIQGVKDKLLETNTTVRQSGQAFTSNWNASVTAVGAMSNALNGMAAQHKNWARAAQVTAIGMAIMNTAEGVTKALAQGGIWGIVLGAIVAAAGAIQIATISSQKFATGTDSVPAMLTPGEMVVPRSMSDAIRAGSLSLSGPGGGGGGQTININISNPVIDNNSRMDDLVSEISSRFARETERI